MTPSMLEGEKIRLRALEPSDVDCLYKWENNPAIWSLSNTLVPFSRYILEKYIESTVGDIYEIKQLRLVIELKDEKKTAIGAIDLFDFDPYNLKAGIGILIAEETNRKKGYATEAIILLEEYSFKTLRLHQLYCNISANNTDSLLLFKKCGFEITGTKKDWLMDSNGWMDEYILQKINTCC